MLAETVCPFHQLQCLPAALQTAGMLRVVMSRYCLYLATAIPQSRHCLLATPPSQGEIQEEQAYLDGEFVARWQCSQPG